MSNLDRALNAICPYYTMFPLDFPLRVLSKHAKKGDLVLDPFCGRGTTIFAARLKGHSSWGIDSSPLAAALADAKVRAATPEQVICSARHILRTTPRASYRLPTGDFWKRAFDVDTLDQLCRLRVSLRKNCKSDIRVILRAIVLGALHGPLAKSEPSYFSNQCPRTFSPKPRYAVGYWKEHGLSPPKVDVISVIAKRAHRYLTELPERKSGNIIKGDCRRASIWGARRRFDLIITSPPYYGMRTYIPDQWLRNWFLGGPARVEYSNAGQLQHRSPDEFVRDLQKVWSNAAGVCRQGARLVIRFGGINDRKIDPITILKASLANTGWRCRTICPAGSAEKGRRQSHQFSYSKSAPIDEFDVYSVLDE